ncbi:MAG: hypothetical protein V2B20_09795 [Pseudomonadota bacterium]
MSRYLSRFMGLILLMVVAGCSWLQSPEPPIVTGQEEEKPVCIEPEESATTQAEEEAIEQQSLTQDGADTLETWGAGGDRALCYRLQSPVPAPKKKKKKISGAVGCCQPQSLIYARCRTGIATCKLGDTSPVQWFTCAKKMGNTSSVPVGGSIMVLDVNKRRKIYTGHPVYVEHARKNSNGTWQLRISHTNYDRQCHLDQDANVIYDPGKMTVSFQTGPWSCWGRDLKILGFIRG